MTSVCGLSADASVYRLPQHVRRMALVPTLQLARRGALGVSIWELKSEPKVRTLPATDFQVGAAWWSHVGNHK